MLCQVHKLVFTCVIRTLFYLKCCIKFVKVVSTSVIRTVSHLVTKYVITNTGELTQYISFNNSPSGPRDLFFLEFLPLKDVFRSIV